MPFAQIASARSGSSLERRGSSPTVRDGSSSPEKRSTAAKDLFVNPAPAPAVGTTLTTTLIGAITPTANNGDGKADPGDTITYTATITNTGASDATGVSFTDTVDPSTTLISGSGVMALDDHFNTIGNVDLNVPVAQGLLANDKDITSGNNTGMTATGGTTSAQGGTIAISSNGSFTYAPPVGFTGNDTFTYTATTAGGKTATATARIAIASRIWFINNNAGACASSCDGRLSHPFTSIANFNAVNDNGVALSHPKTGDPIFIYESATNYTGPVTLLNNQLLIGQDATASLITITGLTQPSGTDPLPVMNSANGTIVNLTSAANAIPILVGNSNTLRGFSVGNTTGAKIISTGANFGTLTTNDLTLTGTGQALNLTSGTLAATFTNITSTSAAGAAGISLATIAGSLTVSGTTAISNTGNEGIRITGSSLTANFGTTNVTTPGLSGIFIQTTTGNITFGATTITNGIEGVDLFGNSAGTRTFGSLSITGSSANALNHGSSGGVGGGNVTVTGATTISCAGNAISVSQPSSGNLLDFQGATSATVTASGPTGVSWAGAAGATMQFLALTIQTNGGIGLNATTGGTVTVTNGTGTINNTTQAASAIVANAVALNANFSAIKSSGGTNGVSLTNVTGTSNFGAGQLTGTVSGATFLISGGSVNVTYSGGVSQGFNAPVVSISGGHNGTINFNDGINPGLVLATGGTGAQFDNADGTYNFNSQLSCNGGDAGVDILNGSDGTFNFASSANISNPSGIAFVVNGGTANVNYNGAITKNNNASATINILGGHNTGTITFQGGTISVGNGTGLQFNNADGTYNFSVASGQTILFGGDAGIDIFNGSGGTFNFGTNVGIVNPTGVAYNETTSTANVTYAGSIDQNNAASAVNISGKTGGTTVFNGAITASTTTANAINLTNTGGTVNFTGGLSLTTTSGVGFNATGGGTVTSTGIDGTLALVTLTASGSNYTSLPIVGFSGGGGSGAAATVAAVVGSANVTNGGSGYTSAPTVTLSGGGGSGATAIALIAGGSVSAVLISNAGSGYTSAPTVGFSGGGGVNAAASTILRLASVNLTSAGSGYTSTPTVSLTGGGGSGATASPALTGSSTLTTTTGTALNVANTTIGASGLIFKRISTNGAAKGIVLNNTGANGGLTVTSSGGLCDSSHVGAGDCTGGTIQGGTTRGAEFTNSANVTLNNMYFNGNATTAVGAGCVDSNSAGGSNVACNAALYLVSTTTTVLNKIYLNGTGSADMGLNGNAVSGLTVNGLEIANFTGNLKDAATLQNLTGTVGFTGLNVHNNTLAHNFFISNTSGTANITLTSPVIQNSPLGGIGQGNADAIQAQSYNAGTTLNITATGVTINNIVGDATNWAPNSGSHMTAVLNGGTVTGVGGIYMASTGTNTQFTYTISNLTSVTTNSGGSSAITVGRLNGTNITETGTISNNTIVTGSSSCSTCSGIVVNSYGISGLATISVTGNNVSGNNFNGMNVVGASGGNSLNIIIQGNTFATTQTSANDGYALDMTSGAAGGDTDCLFANIGDMSAAHTVPANVNTIVGNNWVNGSGGSTISLVSFNNSHFNLMNLSTFTDTGASNWTNASNTPNAKTDAFHLGTNQFGSASCPLLLAVGGISSAREMFPLMENLDFSQLSAVNVSTLATPASAVSNSVNQAQLDSIVTASIQRWASTGLTAQQITTLRGIKFEVTDLAGSYLGQADGNRVQVDRNAEGKGWFVDPNPMSDSSFVSAFSATRLYTDPMNAAAGHVDLLTAIEHEMGHRLGLDDSYAAKDRDSIMYGYLTVGERRLPASGQAKGVQAGSLASTHFLAIDSTDSTDRRVEERGSSPRVSNGVEPRSGEMFIASAAQNTPELQRSETTPSASQNIALLRSVNNKLGARVYKHSVPTARRANHAARRTMAPFAPPVGGTITVSIGTLKPGDSAQITFQVTLNAPPNLTGVPPGTAQVSTHGTVTGTGFISPQDTNTVNTLVDRYDVTNVLTANPNPSNSGAQVTFTATVSPVGSPPATVSGTVNFIDTSNANAVICGAVALVSGVATCQTSSLSNGTHNMRADYSGDGNFDPLNSNVVAQVVSACSSNPIVTSTADSGANTLRDALANVCAAPNNNVTFNLGAGPQTITGLSTLVMAKEANITNTIGAGNGPLTVTANGGNFRVFRIDSPVTTASLFNFTVTGASVTGANGGGLLVQSGTVTLTGMLFTGNTVINAAGGGVGVSGGATLNVRNSTISGNTATFGGGLHNNGGTLNLLNVTVTNNTADGNIGGGPIGGPGAVGGGIETDSGIATNIKNSIVAANSATTGTNISGTATDQGNNILSGDPMIAALANNGGTTRTHALLPTSPAIDAGDNTAANAIPLTTDQRGTGFPRIADSADADTTATVDIGAFELHPSIADITDQSTAEDTLLSFGFNIADGTGALITSVTASSSNTALVPNDVGHLSVTGAGSSRTLNITPAAYANTPANGTATITVTVTATNGQTAQDTFVLTVTEVNDAPTAGSDTPSDILEDSGVYSISIATLLSNDAKGPANESSQTLSLTAVGSPTGGTVLINGANVEFTPSANFNGAAGFSYTVRDNGTTNGVADPKTGIGSVSFNITAVNDAPSFTKGPDQIVLPNPGAQTVNNWATSISAGPADESGQALNFIVTNDNNPLFSAQPAVSASGTLTYTPAVGQTGLANVSVSLHDNGGTANGGVDTSAVQMFTINVSCGQNDLVTNTNDSGAGSLRYAISSACAGDTITFDPALTAGGPATIALTSDELVINKNLTIIGPGANLLTVQRSAVIGTPIFRVFDVQSGTVKISGLTIANGNAVDGALGGTNPGAFGGGIWNNGTLTISNLAVSGNLAGSGGSNAGALAGNGGYGGGVYNSGTLTVVNSTISGNRAGDGGNGGNTGTGGVCGNGGGILNAGTLTVINSTISGNLAGHGGNAGSGGVAGNGGNGGGLSSTGPASIFNSTISGNQAGTGGSAGDTVGASGLGGGIFRGSGTLTLKNTIVAGNLDGAGSGRDDVNGALDATGSFNLIGDGTGMTGISNGSNGNQVGTSGSPINALLGALGSNGGATQTYLLLLGSPAINAGSNALLPPDTFDLDGDNNTAEVLPVDQRGLGFNRVVNTTVDIGAVEVNYSITATAGTGQSAPINSAFATQLQATVTESGANQSGVTVTFTAPASGASGTFPGNVKTANASTDPSGIATAPVFTANGTAGGPYNVVASIAGGSPSANFSLTNLKGDQAITINTHAPASATYNTNFTVAATASSGLPVSYSSAGACTNVGPTFTMTSGTGTCTVKYNQSGNSNYNAAPQVTESVTAQKANQTITVNTHAPASASFNTNFTVAATSNSGLAVAYSSSGVCTNVGATFTMTSGTGTCTVKYDQAGDSNYNAAPQVTESVTAQKVATATAVSSSVNPSEFGQSVTFTATVISIAGTPTGSVQFKDGGVNLGAAQALNAGGVAQLTTSSLTTGPHAITADYSGDANFLTSTGSLSGGQVVKSQPSLSINDVSFAEGNSGTTSLIFTVTLSAASNLTVNVNYATANGTATVADNDYQATSGTLTFNPGDLTKTVTVLVNGDQKFEADETVLVNLTSPVNATISDNQGTGTILNDDTLQLILDESGPDANQAAAFDSFMFLRDAFHVQNVATWFNLGPDPNTRVILFAANLQLNQGETASAVVVNLVDANNQTFDVPAEDVRQVPGFAFTQVKFRLPNNLAAGVCMVTIKAHGQISNTGTMRIVLP